MTDTLPDEQQIQEITSGFQQASVIGAAAELDLFTVLAREPLSAAELAERLPADRRGITILLDAVAALGFLSKQEGRYGVPKPLVPLLSEGSQQNILPMLRHRMNVLRSWSQLAWAAKTGVPFPRQASIRGPMADREVFLAAMDVYSRQAAEGLVAQLGPPEFGHLLDVGGATGTWTLAFLRAVPGARATIFDLPDAIAKARRRIATTGLAQRISLVAGDFYIDDLPGGADYAWVSGIVHQHSRQHNRDLFAKVHAALEPGGRIAVRDVVMEPSRTEPMLGALFAINMLVNTRTGGTFTFQELAEDLQAAGFINPLLQVRHEAMNSVVVAMRP
jgi:hypothetical protein